MSSIDRINTAFWSRITESTRLGDEQLALCRIVVGLFVLTIHPAKHAWVAELPQALFDPPIISLGSLLSGFPNAFFLKGLDSLMIAALIAFIAGIRVRLAAVVYTLAHLAGAQFAYSFGKIDHNILLPMAVFCHALTNSGRLVALVPDPPRVFRLRGETLLAVLLAFGMFTAGLPKALIWFDLDLGRSGFLAWFFDGYYSLGRQYLLAPLVLRLPDFVIESFDYVAIVFELTPFLMLLLGRRFWRGWVIFALVFHIASSLLLNIASYIHMPVYFAFFVSSVPWSVGDLKRLHWVCTPVALALGVIHFVSIWGPFEFVSPQVFLLPQDEHQLYFYTGCWCILLIIAILNFRQLFAPQASYGQPAVESL